MFPLFKNKDIRTCALVFDIGSGSVGGAVVVYSDERVPYIKYTTRSDMPFQEDLDIDRFQQGMVRALQDVVHDIEKNGLDNGDEYIPPTHAHCFLASPWFASKTEVITKKEETPFDVDRELIATEVNRAIDQFKQSKEVIEHLGSGSAELIGKNIVDIHLNGYAIDDPYGKEAQSLKLVLSLSITPADAKQGIEKELKRGFHVDLPLSFHTFPAAASHVIRSIETQTHSFLHIDVSGEVSDVSVVQDGVLYNTESFPVGKKTLIRRIAKKLKTTPAEALSLLRLYEQGRVSTSQKKEVKEAFEHMEETWLSAFQDTLQRVSDLAIPKDVYVNADKDILPFVEQLIQKEEMAQYTMTESTFVVHPLNTSFFSGMCQFSQDVARDVFLITEAVFVDTLREV